MEKRMKTKSILFLNRVAPPGHGASGRVLNETVHAFRTAGWQADFLSCTIKGAGLKDYLFAWLILFWKLARAPHYDVVVFMTDPPLLVCQLLFLPFSRTTKLIHWCHDLYPDLLPAMGYKFPPPLIALMQRMATYAMNRCDAVIAIGRCMKNQLVKNGVNADGIIIISNWAPLQLQPVPYAPQTALRILYAGNFGLNHPLEPLLQTAEHFRNQPQLQFIFSGSGKKRNWLVNEIAERNLPNCIVKDFVPDDQLNVLLAEGDIHVTAMSDDALGLLVPCKIYSAPAAGRYSLFLGPATSEAALFVTDNNLGTCLENNEEQIILWLDRILSDRATLDETIRTLQPPPAALPRLVAFMERLL